MNYDYAGTLNSALEECEITRHICPRKLQELKV